MPPTLPDLEHMARQAGEILRAGYGREHQVGYKGLIDLVTEVDRQSEAFLLGEVQRTFPGHQIISEEIGLVPGQAGDQWLIDPLDGTINYAHGIPLFSVSIAYAHEGVMQLGVVYDPCRNELFSAEYLQGAQLNGCPIHVSQIAELQRSLLVTGFPYDAWSATRNNLDYFGRLTRMTQGVRRLGSAALDLSYVAAGRFDGFWELSLNPWDVAAGGLIAAEAGARVTTINDTPDYITPPCSILAASPAMHAKILAVLSENA
ncbi:MAG: inositol monophosphatase family protein [Anaerolineales bacterium]|jgi:myo-inositol-1(or 4)-monophosphatase